MTPRWLSHHSLTCFYCWCVWNGPLTCLHFNGILMGTCRAMMLLMEGIIWSTGSLCSKISRLRHRSGVCFCCYKAIQWRWISDVSVVAQTISLASDPHILCASVGTDWQVWAVLKVFSGGGKLLIWSHNPWNPRRPSETGVWIPFHFACGEFSIWMAEAVFFEGLGPLNLGSFEEYCRERKVPRSHYVSKGLK